MNVFEARALRRAAACALLAVWAGPAAAGDGPLPRIYFEAIADGSPALAVGGVRFTALPDPPIIDGDTVYFTGTRADGAKGIYRRRRGTVEACVDTSTAIPGGGKFTAFEGTPAAEGGRLAFRGLGTGGRHGVYLLADGQLTRVADTSTAAPGGRGRFTELGSPAFAGRDVVFIGRAKGAETSGLYRVDTTGAVTAVADATVAVPGREARFRGVDRVSSFGGRVIFAARDSTGGAGMYALTGAGLARVAGTEARVSGDPFARLGDIALDRSGETAGVAFSVPTPKAGKGGLFAALDGAQTVIVEVPPGIGHGSDFLSRFEGLSVHRDRVFFVAHSDARGPSVFGWRAGKLFPVTIRDPRVMDLGGRRPKHFTIAPAAASALGLAFQATLEDGTQGIYLAHLREDSGRAVLSDTLHGRSLGQVSGGRFVEGGGWTALANGDRIVWTLPPMSRNGMLAVDVRNFDPPRQLTADKNIFMGLWGTLFSNHEHFGLPDTDNWEIRIGKGVEQFKVEYHARGFGKAGQWAPFDVPFDAERTYRFRVEWREGRVSTWIDDRVLHFEGFAEEPVDRFRFLHIGTSPAFGAEVTRGPIYSNVRLVTFD